jgi:hypothetical protein
MDVWYNFWAGTECRILNRKDKLQMSFKFTLQDKKIFHQGVMVDEYASKGNAYVVFNMLQAAYAEGVTDGQNSSPVFIKTEDDLARTITRLIAERKISL